MSADGGSSSIPSAKIMHVEDEGEWAKLVRGIFTGTCYKIHRATTGAKALDLAVELLPDLVILDIELPDISGHRLLEKLRGLPSLTRLPAICFSAHNDEKVRSLQIGADAYVSKASGGAELLPTVEALMRRVQMDAGILVKQDLKLDPRSNAVYQAGRHIATLTPKEFLFFYTLVNKSPEAVSERMLRATLGESELSEESRALVMLATRTRKRLGNDLATRIRGSRCFGWIYSTMPVRG